MERANRPLSDPAVLSEALAVPDPRTTASLPTPSGFEDGSLEAHFRATMEAACYHYHSFDIEPKALKIKKTSNGTCYAGLIIRNSNLQHPFPMHEGHITLAHNINFPDYNAVWRAKTDMVMMLVPRQVSAGFRAATHSWYVHENSELGVLVEMLRASIAMWHVVEQGKPGLEFPTTHVTFNMTGHDTLRD